jgi:hypothetical protein
LNGTADGSLPLVSSVLGALVYADLFDAPLSLDELYRYQVATSYPIAEIGQALSHDPVLLARVATNGTYYCLKGRETLFAVREERAAASREVWKRAELYARWVRRLPFVRMVAVTGALAVNNVSGRHDIDLLVIAKAGRVWLCRRGLIACVRLGRLLGDDLCPNFILSEGSLVLSQRDFFTAHELAQMVPVFGDGLYGQMLRANAWAGAYLPALSETMPQRKTGIGRAYRTGPLERVLQRRTFDGWERWELARLRRKLRSEIGRDTEVVLTPDQCKGHTGLHRAAVMNRYLSRLSEMGLQDVIAALEQARARTT